MIKPKHCSSSRPVGERPDAEHESNVNRRRFVQTAAASMMLPIVATASDAASGSRDATVEQTPTDSAAAHPLKGRLHKTLKINMASGVKGSLSDKFRAIKEAGFSGVEMNSPGMDVGQTNAAIVKTGLIVDGSVCSSHWKIRHTSPVAEERAQALADLQTALRDTNAVGGKTVLLVVGHGKDGDEEVIWKRSIDNINKALPLAAELGVTIALENVWNEFLYDPDGGQEQTAEKIAEYVDEVNSPWFGVQFDIGNHWKYGSMGDWIRRLGKRVVKLDLKGYSRANQDWANIGEGDIDWQDVRKALLEINYHGWAAAEVRGGDSNRLKQISANMDKVFGLT